MATTVSAPPKGEVGHASVTPWSAFAVSDEHAPQLTWPASVNTYHKMRADAQVDALTKSITLPIRRLRWMLEPNGAREEVVQQVAADLALPVRGWEEATTRGRRRFSYDEYLRHSILGLWYGHMFFEQVGIIDDDLAWRLRKLAPRLPQSLTAIEAAPDGGLKQIKQHDPKDYNGKVIPVDRLVAFVWEREGANWLGRSMLRPLYRHWLLKDRLLRIDAIKNERFGVGIPTGQAPAGGDPSDYSKMAQAIRATEDSGVGLPAGASIGVEGIRGTLPDTLASINYHDEAMARSFMAMVVQLGQTQTGSRALGETFASFFQMAIDAIADWHADTTSTHVVEDMVDWNWGPDEQAPLVVWEKPDESDLAVSDLTALIDKGILVVDEQLESWIRERHKLPARAPAEDTDDVADAATSPFAQVGLPALVDSGIISREEARALIGLTGPAPTPEQITEFVAALSQGATPTVAAGMAAARREKIVAAAKQTVDDPTIGHRERLEHEVRAATDFEAMQSLWQDATEELVQEWAEVRATQIDALVEAVAEAVEAGDATALASLSAPVLGEDLIQARMMTVAEEAVAAARAEAAAQGVTIGLIDVADELEPMITANARAVAALNARAISESAARQALLRYGVDNLSAADVAAGVREHLEDLSDAYLNDQLGGALTMAQNTARVAVMKRGAQRVYASELLDLNTCTNCAGIDGKEYASITEAQEDYPTGGHKDCLGGPRCRGTLVAVYDEAEATT